MDGPETNVPAGAAASQPAGACREVKSDKRGIREVDQPRWYSVMLHQSQPPKFVKRDEGRAEVHSRPRLEFLGNDMLQRVPAHALGLYIALNRRLQLIVRTSDSPEHPCTAAYAVRPKRGFRGRKPLQGFRDFRPVRTLARWCSRVARFLGHALEFITGAASDSWPVSSAKTVALNKNQPPTDAQGHRFGARPRIQLAQDRRHVEFCGVFGDAQ